MEYQGDESEIQGELNIGAPGSNGLLQKGVFLLPDEKIIMQCSIDHDQDGAKGKDIRSGDMEMSKAISHVGRQDDHSHENPP